jgi:hypothetical protein
MECVVLLVHSRIVSTVLFTYQTPPRSGIHVDIPVHASCSCIKYEIHEILLCLFLFLIPELAVHDVVNVTVTTNEDIWRSNSSTCRRSNSLNLPAVKLNQPAGCVHGFLDGQTMAREVPRVHRFLDGQTLAREVPVFGAPFEEDVFVVGSIDERRFDPETYAIEISELKLAHRGIHRRRETSIACRCLCRKSCSTI